MPLKTHADSLPSMNMTPMVDVMFQLIIFFMVGTSFTDPERSIALKVPSVAAHGALTDAPRPKIVNVYQDGRITLDRQEVTLNELTNRLAAARSQYKQLGVLVRGDGQGLFQPVADVLSACKRAGIAEMAIAVRVANAED
jgi:biopolymer transport protein ExbD